MYMYIQVYQTQAALVIINVVCSFAVMPLNNSNNYYFISIMCYFYRCWLRVIGVCKIHLS